jgi:hypothetical protein
MRDPLLFFNADQATVIAAAAARIFPSDDLGPGAPEAGVIIYIDRALAGPYAAAGDLYRQAAAGLERASQNRFGMGFTALPETDQDALLAAAERDELTPYGVPPGFLSVLIRHTREGMFCDPAHGGNRDLVGWKMLGYPGIHRVWTEADQQIGATLAPRPLTTLADDGFAIAHGRPRRSGEDRDAG